MRIRILILTSITLTSASITQSMIFEKYTKQLNKNTINISLNAYDLSLSCIAATIDKLQGRNFEDFDADGGDNSCQVRAVKSLHEISILSNEKLQIIKNNVLETQKDLKELKKNNTITQKYKQVTNLSLETILQDNKCLATVPNAIIYFTLCYFRTQKNENNIVEKAPTCGIETKKDQLFGNTKGTLNILARDCKSQLMNYAITFLQEQAKTLETSPMAIELQTGLKQVDGALGWKSCSTYIGMRLLLEECKAKQYPIKLIVNTCQNQKRASTVLEFEFAHNIYVLQNKISQKNTLVIEGISFDGSLSTFKQEYEKSSPVTLPEEETVIVKKSIEQFSLEDIILANSAQHSQFPGGIENTKHLKIDFSNIPLLREEYTNHKLMAENNGMTPNNMKLFLIQHIFAQSCQEKK